MSSTSSTPARSLRVALYAWPRAARRESGAVMLDLAQELVDGGASARREARTLFATGLRVRGRRYLDGMRFAPWSDARRIAVLWSTALIAAFIVASSGGWSGRGADGDVGAGFIDLEQFSRTLTGGWSLLALVAVAAATAAARMRVAAGLMLLAGLVGFQTWVVTPAFLGLTTLDLGVTHVDGVGPVQRWFSIVVGGVVGLLALVAFLAALIDGLRDGRADVPAARAVRALLLWCAGVALMPLGARLAWNAIDDLAVRSADVGGPLPMLLLWGAAGVALLTAIALPRIKPAYAVAAMLNTVALVIPIYWTVFASPPVLVSPLGSLIGGSLVGFWGSAVAFAVVLALTVPACAGHAARSRGDSSPTARRRSTTAS